MPASRTSRTHDQALDASRDEPSAPSLPALAIIAPTPRTFTFSDSHQLNLTPYSTPSTSPFEPDLSSLDLTSPVSSCLPTPPSLSRTLSLDSPSVFSVSSLSLDRTSTSVDADRRPKKGDDDYIKRPENAFILFRRKCCEERAQEEEEAHQTGSKKQRQADLSKTISQRWKTLSKQDRQQWEDLAKEKKREHQQMYPDYVYRPQRHRDQDGKVRNRKYTKRKDIHRADTGEITMDGPPSRSIGRSTSAPTPPPSAYQTLHIPNVLASPSCPSSPTLLPMISQRAVYAGRAENIMSDFDYYIPSIPSAPRFDRPNYEAGLESSETPRYGIPEQDATAFQRAAGAQLLPLGLTLGSPETSSTASSSTSGPFTPSSAILSHPSFSQMASLPNTYNANQEAGPHLDIQAYIPISHGPGQPTSSWDSSVIWQSEPSVLMQSDFDLDAIPSVELEMPRYPDGVVFEGDQTLAGFYPEGYQECYPEYGSGDDFP
ncbi:hypothetical protein BDP27DRAFT_1312786 [Rhodocollybia butyracea]|uniref:HMG box domain-containing protein n=1 Tax=Rhodocollybia butyracea TaxID=206335 RepID=A0A9P5Q7H0_9AGAR|nr:hypothetical protein BDP27DRAFT_1312786 [Rhodocollybia butyracea]